jgi:hypothetical protein
MQSLKLASETYCGNSDRRQLKRLPQDVCRSDAHAVEGDHDLTASVSGRPAQQLVEEVKASAQRNQAFPRTISRAAPHTA